MELNQLQKLELAGNSLKDPAGPPHSCGPGQLRLVGTATGDSDAINAQVNANDALFLISDATQPEHASLPGTGWPAPETVCNRMATNIHSAQPCKAW